ncbi:MAG: NAD(P)-binding domain-containing protein [Deltaproteobacteria bacterium]|nr:NAD(P)-binding domain-containing protein [Deltaproteobacteria bacterium]
MNAYDVVIVGAGPGGLACAIQAKQMGLRYVLLEKGSEVFQGIIDSYPTGKKVYPSIPKGETSPLPFRTWSLLESNAPVETYFEKVDACIRKIEIQTLPGGGVPATEQGPQSVYPDHVQRLLCARGRSGLRQQYPGGTGHLRRSQDRCPEARKPCRSPECANAGYRRRQRRRRCGGRYSPNAKRAAGDDTPVYWANKMEHFKINKDVARDLGEEILLGGHIKILQGAVPKIGEVDEEGVERLPYPDPGGGLWQRGQFSTVR